MKAILVQPPFVQLNAPYPAIHYLDAYLRSKGHATSVHDHSIEVYRALYSREGLAKVFAAMESRPLGPARGPAGGQTGAGAAGQAFGETERRELARYLSLKPLYLEWIDGLVSFLAGAEPAMAHRLASAAEFPRGARAAAYLEAAGGRIRCEEAQGLATAILEDLADLIRYSLDPDFGTVRYGERLAKSLADFGAVRAALDEGWFIRDFYRPWAAAFWKAQAEAVDGAGSRGPVLILVTIPFPGCLAGALACALEARAAFAARGLEPVIVFGGGYVSTELRELTDPGLFDFCDYLSFDAGFGSLASLLARLAGGDMPLHLTMARKDGRVLAEGFGEGGTAPAEGSPFAAEEREALASVFPDYAGADFGRYLRAMDSDNAMHRLWSDTPWLKYSLAHGCYWARCAFCDTELDYVANYVPAVIEPLVAAADRAARRSGLHGIHFVDEAMPMSGLLAFAAANRARAAAGKRPFSFWGNVRFDASWTEGRCEYLAASGLVAVSGGIEIATEGGLELTDKGFDLPRLVKTLVCMKRSGLLVHSYLIYGFPGQSGRDIVDSAEVVRQLFAAGLVDSAFWHRFVLTRHSRMMAEYRAGGRRDLRPLEAVSANAASGPAGAAAALPGAAPDPSDAPGAAATGAARHAPAEGRLFAANDLGFEGEEAFDVYDAPLVSSLEAWMQGEELERPAASWFEASGGHTGLAGAGRDGSARRASGGSSRAAKRGPATAGIQPGHIEALIARAEAELDAALPEAGRRAAWVAGLPLVGDAGRGKARLSWACRGELVELELPPVRAARLRDAIADLASRAEPARLGDFLARADLAEDDPVLRQLLGAGLAAL
jgi:radical SAM superfamily enzyme YgiQ (UPF0313 family)